MNFDKKVIVIDDFYQDPFLVRNIALNAQYEQESRGNYPGRNSIENFWDSEDTQLFCEITGESLTHIGQPFCGKFRFTCKGDIGKQYIHFDPSPNQLWAGVIYLSLPEHYNEFDAGTIMYSHIHSGMSIAPKDLIESKKINVASVEDMVRFFETEGLDSSMWKPELNINIKFNRLVLFRPWMWHSMGNYFGSDITNSRLTQLIFLNRK